MKSVLATLSVLAIIGGTSTALAKKHNSKAATAKAECKKENPGASKKAIKACVKEKLHPAM